MSAYGHQTSKEVGSFYADPSGYALSAENIFAILNSTRELENDAFKIQYAGQEMQQDATQVQADYVQDALDDQANSTDATATAQVVGGLTSIGAGALSSPLSRITTSEPRATLAKTNEDLEPVNSWNKVLKDNQPGSVFAGAERDVENDPTFKSQIEGLSAKFNQGNACTDDDEAAIQVAARNQQYKEHYDKLVENVRGRTKELETRRDNAENAIFRGKEYWLQIAPSLNGLITGAGGFFAASYTRDQAEDKKNETLMSYVSTTANDAVKTTAKAVDGYEALQRGMIEAMGQLIANNQV